MHAPARFSTAQWQPRCQRSTLFQPVTRLGQADITATLPAGKALVAKALLGRIPAQKMRRNARHRAVKISPAAGC
jgi:hypothetical protein